MATNEILATVGPALGAAGAATLVGWQGVEQMLPRLQAINATAESLGPAYGITSGSFLGTGSQIQRFQNLAAGGVYELGGAGINLMKAGQGAFGQIGLNTIAMLDRGVAQMQVNMAQRGTMGTLTGLLGGGTGYLQQFGDIGASLGNIFLGLAPHLPGVGGDYLSILQAATGGIAGGIGFLNQHNLGQLLGLGMAGEAGWRVGTPMVGLLGRGLGGLGGLAGRAGLGRAAMSAADLADIEALTGVGLEGAGAAGGAGLAGLLGGAGELLAGLGGPEVAALAMMAYGGGKLLTYQGPQQRQMAALQGQIGQMGFVQGWQPLADAIKVSAGLASSHTTAPFAGTGITVDGVMLPAGRLAAGQQAANARWRDTSPYAQAEAGFSRQMTDVMNAGPQLLATMKKAGFQGATMADAFQFAQNALLDFGHSFDSKGHLTQAALQQMMNYGAALKPMTQNYGAFGAALAAQTIMGSPQMKDLSTVNQAMDSMTQIMTGGPAGMANLFGMLGGARAKPTPAMAQMAKALTSFTTAGGAGAWNQFAGQQGFIAAEQNNLDQLRTYLTLGPQVMTQPQAAGVAGFQIQQMLPMARQSPAALAMLMQQMVQGGITAKTGMGGYYNPAMSQGQNYQAAVQALAQMASSAGQVNAAMNHAVEATSNLPEMAKQFSQQFQPGVLAQEIAGASSSMHQVLTTAMQSHKVNLPAIQDLVANMKLTGMDPAHIKSQIQSMISSLPKDLQIKIMADVAGALGPIGNVQQALAQLHDSHHKIEYDVGQALANAQAATAAGESVPDITRYITYIVQMAGQVTGSPGGIPYTPAGIAANVPGQQFFRRQTGGLVPGSGFGDIIPAMLEPGEAIVPRNLVPLVAPLLAAHHVPGFGGAPQGSSSHFAAGGITPLHGPVWVPPTVQGGGGTQAARDFIFTLLGNIAGALKHTSAARLAQELVNKITQEVAYAKNVASAAMQGQGYGNAGLLGTFTAPPAGYSGTPAPPGARGYSAASWNAYVANFAADQPAPQTPQQQLQSYLKTVRSFGGDIGKLRHEHLNKDLIAQLIGMGPVQGDAMAQAIMSGGGGVAQMNKLWAQLGIATKGLGAQAAMSQYGGFLSADLKHDTVNVGGITINIQSKGGATLALTPAQIKQIVEEVQKKLLQQARRNQKTGVQAHGKGA
jgi:hypothetical protein